MSGFVCAEWIMSDGGSPLVRVAYPAVMVGIIPP